MPTRSPQAVRQRAVAAARQRAGQPATPNLDPVFVALNPGALPARERSSGELFQWVRRDEEYATLGANVVVELNSESRARQPTSRAWAIIRRAERAHRHTSDRQGRGERRQADRASRSDRTSRSHHPEERIPPSRGAGDGCRCPLIPPRRRALDADGQLVTHPCQGSALGFVSAGSRPRPARTMYRWRPLWTARLRWHVDQTWIRPAMLSGPTGWNEGRGNVAGCLVGVPEGERRPAGDGWSREFLRWPASTTSTMGAAAAGSRPRRHSGWGWALVDVTV
jgi:hypothetical protein